MFIKSQSLLQLPSTLSLRLIRIPLLPPLLRRHRALPTRNRRSHLPRVLSHNAILIDPILIRKVAHVRRDDVLPEGISECGSEGFEGGRFEDGYAVEVCPLYSVFFVVGADLILELDLDGTTLVAGVWS